MAFGRETESERRCRLFRELLTKGFYAVGPDGVIHELKPEGEEQSPVFELAIGITKHWRGELWKQFREIEDALCPVKKFEEGRGV